MSGFRDLGLGLRGSFKKGESFILCALATRTLGFQGFGFSGLRDSCRGLGFRVL